MMKRVGRLFVIKSRWEAWAVIWAITLGAVERGKTYLNVYPGAIGWMFMLACTAVVFLAGAKLLDSVRPVPPRARKAVPVPARRGPRIIRSRVASSRRGGGSGAPLSNSGR